MRKRVILALVLVFALLASSSCSLIIKDEAVDMATPVIEVAGKTITKGEVKEQIEAYLDYNESMYYYYYGMTYDRTSDEAIAEAQQQAIEGLIQQAVVDAKVAEYGFDVFTEEELAEIEATAQEDYQLYYDTVKNFALGGTELTGDELEAAVLKEMEAMGYPNKEQLLEEGKMAKAQEKLSDEMNKGVAVTDEELAAEYSARVEEAKAAYEADPSAYGTALTNDETPYYAPAGYRYVKHILLQFNAEDQDLMDDLDAQISDKNSAIAALAEGEDASALTAELEALQVQYNAALETAYANLQPTVDEINAKLAEGANFSDLITEYNTDTGMTADSIGYPVSAASIDWVDEFTDASMALTAIGDVSEPVRSAYGIHIIQYASDIAEGEIGLDAVHTELHDELLIEKQNANIEVMLQQWVEEANAVVNEKAMK